MGVPQDSVPSKVSPAETPKFENCNKKFKSKEIQPILLPIQNEVKPQACKVCFKVLSKNESLSKHMLLHSPARPHSCEVCKFRFMRRHHLSRHMLRHPGNTLVPKKVLNNSPERPYHCETCLQRFTRQDHVRRHMLIHTGIKPEVCKSCSRRFSRKDHLAKHKCSIPPPSETHPQKFEQKVLPPHVNACETVMKPSVKVKLSRHVYKAGKSYVCKVCDKKFIKEIHLSNHVCIRAAQECETGLAAAKEVSINPSSDVGNQADKLHTCSVCSMKFSDSKNLKWHMVLHKDPHAEGKAPVGAKKTELHVCKMCKKQFARKAHLASHMRVHVVKTSAKNKTCDEKPTEKGHVTKLYKCDLCFITLATEEDLTKHGFTHVSKKSHVCDTCKETFETEENLSQHVAIHVNKCFMCDVESVSEEYLQSHQLVCPAKPESLKSEQPPSHAETKPYSCKICAKRFMRKVHLLNHVRVHVDSTVETHSAVKNPNESLSVSTRRCVVKLHICSVCSKGFSEKLSLKWHMTLHSKKNSPVVKSKQKRLSASADTVSECRVCKVCSKKFAKQQHLAAHMRIHKNRRGSKSKICPKRTAKVDLSHSEISTKGFENHQTVLICEKCDEKFGSKESLLQHVVKHGDNVFTCDSCDVKFACEESLKSHQCICPNKPKESLNNKQLERCGPICETGKPFQKKSECYVCEVCSRKFSMKRHLGAHMRIHKARKTLKNKIPAEKLTKDVLSHSTTCANDQAAHVDTDTHVCETCAERFESKESLLQHIIVHGNESFICDACNMKFEHEENLVGHQLICVAKLKESSNVGQCAGRDSVRRARKPHTCEICAKKFARKVYLLNHMRMHATDSSCAVKTHTIIQNANDLSDNADGHKSLSKEFSESLNGPTTSHKDSPEKRLSEHVCNFCSKGFAKKAHLASHKRFHKSKKFAQNKISAKRPKNACSNLFGGIASPQSVFVCEVCSLKCECEEHLLNHKLLCLVKPKESVNTELTFAGGGPGEISFRDSKSMEILYDCQAIRSSEELQAKIHTSDPSTENYSCPICKKKYLRKENLSRHLLTHERTQPLECQTCFQKFLKKKLFVRHRCSHKTTDLYVCETCEEKFKTKDHLSVHDTVHEFQRLCIGEMSVTVSATNEASAENVTGDTIQRDTVNCLSRELFIEEMDVRESCSANEAVSSCVSSNEFIQLAEDNLDETGTVEFPTENKMCNPAILTSEFIHPANNPSAENSVGGDELSSDITACVTGISDISGMDAKKSCAVGEICDPSLNDQLSRNKFLSAVDEGEKMCVKEDHLLSDVLTKSPLSKTCNEERRSENNSGDVPTDVVAEYCASETHGSGSTIRAYTTNESETDKTTADVLKDNNLSCYPMKELEVNQMCTENPVKDLILNDTPVCSAGGVNEDCVSNDTSKFFSCETCNKTFKKKKQLLGHLINHKQKEHFICKVCNKHFRKKYLLIKHNLIHKFKSVVNKASQNIQSHSSAISHICEIRDKEFSKQADLQNHKVIHEVRKSEPCNKKVEEPFSTVPVCMGQELSARKTASEGNVPELLPHCNEIFECKVCSVRFSDLLDLMTHITTTSCSKPYKCKTCLENFSSEADLKSHMSTHTQSHECKMCSRTFPSMMELCEHAFTHSVQL